MGLQCLPCWYLVRGMAPEEVPAWRLVGTWTRHELRAAVSVVGGRDAVDPGTEEPLTRHPWLIRAP